MHTRGHRGTGPGSLLPPALSLLALLLAGCAAPRPEPEAEGAVAHATGVGEAVTFRTEGGPLDEPGAGGQLTLQDAVRRAVTTDPGLQAALARVRIAMADADQARLLPNPVLDFVLRWGPGKAQIEVSLAQELIQVLRIPREASAADNRLRRASAEAVTIALDLAAEVQERYAAAGAHEAVIAVLAERRGLSEKLIGTARARLEAQEGTRADVTVLEAQRVEIDVEIAEERAGVREERLRLARLIGEPSGAAAWRLEPWSAPAPADAAEEAWIEAALARRPEVQSAAWELAALGDEGAIVGLLAWDGAGAGIDVQRDDTWSAGPSVSLPIPVFDMGQAARARNAAEQAEARHELTLAKRMVVEDVRTAMASYRAGVANLARVRSEFIPLQELRRRQAEEAYRAGLTDVSVLFTAEDELRAARGREIDVEHRMSVALIRLERAAGGAGVASEVGKSAFADARPEARP